MEAKTLEIRDTDILTLENLSCETVPSRKLMQRLKNTVTKN
jgi:hypothetical protein